MSIEAPIVRPDIRVVHSNLSLPLPLQLGGSVSQIEEFAFSTGSDGLQLTPQHSVFWRRVLARAEATQREGYAKTLEDEAISVTTDSGHSGFRRDDNDKGLVVPLFFPKMSESLRWLSGLQLLAGSIAVVLYSSREGGPEVYNKDNAPFKERSIQPKVADWLEWELPETAPVEMVAQALRSRGFASTRPRTAADKPRQALMTYDGSHDKGFDDPLGLCRRLSGAGLIVGFHVSVNRWDLFRPWTTAGKRTLQEGKAFASSAQAAAKTETGEKLLIVAHDWKTDPRHTGQQRSIAIEKPAFTTRKTEEATVSTIRELVEMA